MRVAAAVTKSLSWRGHVEQFSNVWHYDFGVGGGITPGAMSALADKIVTEEKLVHSSYVTFVSTRVWETGGTAAENETLLIRDESGTGSLAAVQGIYAECAVLVQWYTGRHSTTGRRIYLRKFIHPQYLPSSVSGVERGSAPLGSAQKAPFLTFGQNMRAFNLLAGLEAVTMESPSGDNNANDASVTVADYMHVRQFTR